MLEVILSALLIMCLRIADVTIGTFRTILVIQAKKYPAAIAGFFEVLIWIFAMKYIVDRMDNTINLFGYAAGFAVGNLLGITLEEKMALGYVQLNIISRNAAKNIVEALRDSQFGVTLLPAEGYSGKLSVMIVIVRRRDVRRVMKMVDSLDPNAFITQQHSRPYRGFIHASRK